MDTMVLQLPLAARSKLLLLHASLQARVAHLMQTAPRQALATRMHHADLGAISMLLCSGARQPCWGRGRVRVEHGANMEGPDEESSGLGQQMMLALLFGAWLAHAGRRGLGRYVCGRRWPIRAQPEGAALCPLQRATVASMQVRWSSLRERHAQQCRWNAVKDAPAGFLDSKEELLGRSSS